MINEAREALEDKVYDLHAELDMTEIQRMSDEQLMGLINLSRPNNRNLSDQPKQSKQSKLARVTIAKWQKVSAQPKLNQPQSQKMYELSLELVFRGWG